MGIGDAIQLKIHPYWDALTGGNSKPLPEPTLSDDAYEEMKSYKKLKDGWNGWDGDELSKAPFHEDIDNALQFFDNLPDDAAKPKYACASCDGTIDWDWRNNGVDALVSFYDNGKVLYSAENGKGRKSGKFKASDPVPNELLECLRRRFDAE